MLTMLLRYQPDASNRRRAFKMASEVKMLAEKSLGKGAKFEICPFEKNEGMATFYLTAELVDDKDVFTGGYVNRLHSAILDVMANMANDDQTVELRLIRVKGVSESRQGKLPSLSS